MEHAHKTKHMPPVYMPKIKKTRQKRNLADTETFITDESENSPQYFNISQLNQELSLGKNGFAVQGSENLRAGAEIAIEVVDSVGDVIYHEVRNYKEDAKRIVGIFVYQDTAPGPATITVLSEAIRDANGVPVPPNQRNRFNVKWTRSVNVNPNKFNDDQIRFIREPELILSDEVYTKKQGKFASESASLERIGDPDFTPIEIQEQGEDFSSFPLYTLSQGTPRVSGTVYPTKQWPYDYFMIKAGSFDWIDGNMDDETLIISKDALPLNRNMTVRLTEIVNERYARFEIVTEEYRDYLKKFSFDTETFFLLYRRDPFAYEQKETAYYKNIQIGFMQTLTGECIRAQVYNRLRNERSSFEFVGNFEIEPVELLTDIEDQRTELVSPVGVIDSQSHIDRFFTSDSNCNLNFNNDFLAKSVQIQPNATGLAEGTYQASIDFQNPDIQRFTFFSYSEYTVSFQAAFNSETPIDSTLEVFLTGSPFFDRMVKIGDVDLNQETYHITTVSENFVPDQTAESFQSDSTATSFEIIFKVNSPQTDVSHEWYVRDISLQPAQEAGFSPDYSILRVPIDTTKYGSNELSDLEYKVDLFDINGNKAGVNIVSG